MTVRELVLDPGGPMGAQILILFVAGYAGIGVVVGAWHLIRSGPREMPALRGSPRSVRLLLFPGALAVWPLLLTRPPDPGAHP